MCLYAFLCLYTNRRKAILKKSYIILSLRTACCGNRNLSWILPPNPFFDHSWQRFSHSQFRAIRPHRTGAPNTYFPCASFLKKSPKPCQNNTSHSKRGLHSPGGLSTNVYQPFRSCWLLNLNLVVSREDEGGKAKVWPTLLLDSFLFLAVPLTESATTDDSYQLQVRDILYAWLNYKVG